MRGGRGGVGRSTLLPFLLFFVAFFFVTRAQTCIWQFWASVSNYHLIFSYKINAETYFESWLHEIR